MKISPEDKCSGYIRKVKKMDKILSLLENDAKLTPEQLAVMLGKETGDIKRAIEEYEREGVILGYQALVDWDKTDREYVTALIEAIYTMIEQQQEACRVLIFQNVCPNVLRRMISLARGESIAYWKQHLHRVTEAELEMLYTHLSNGLMHVVVEGYEKYSREEVVRFVNRIVQCSLSQFQ